MFDDYAPEHIIPPVRKRGTGRVDGSHAFDGVVFKLHHGAVELRVLGHHFREEVV